MLAIEFQIIQTLVLKCYQLEMHRTKGEFSLGRVQGLLLIRDILPRLQYRRASKSDSLLLKPGLQRISTKYRSPLSAL